MNHTEEANAAPIAKRTEIRLIKVGDVSYDQTI
jgi:hypothetical protein